MSLAALLCLPKCRVADSLLLLLVNLSLLLLLRCPLLLLLLVVVALLPLDWQEGFEAVKT